MPRSYIPPRLQILERFGAAVYTYLFRRAQGHTPAVHRIKSIGREYLRAGGTERGLRSTIEHVQQQAAPVLESWYELEPGDMLVGGAQGALATAMIAVIEDRPLDDDG